MRFEKVANKQSIYICVLLLTFLAAVVTPFVRACSQENMDRQRARREFEATRRDFAQFVQMAVHHRLTLVGPTHYFFNDGDEVENDATDEFCTLLAGDQIQLRSYDDRSRTSVFEIFPNPDAAAHYKADRTPDALRWAGRGEAA